MFFEEGRNCWKVLNTHRAAFLIDGEAYFKALADACEKAQRAVYIIGWDIDSRIRLRRDRRKEQKSFGEFIDHLVREKTDLQVYILDWDFSMLYSLERESWPLLSFGWQTHEKVHFSLDDSHPVGASHHQKIVVVDDQLAFVGGLDLASCRWDTSEHSPSHSDRCDHGLFYDPFHDVQTMVEGPIARELGHLARNRWQLATGEQLPAVEKLEASPWPQGFAPDLENARIAILRTEPEYNNRKQILEIENFYRDAIAQARTSIYIENQYLTSHVVEKALARSLQKKNGPEILLVLPRECSGWLEKETMGALRQELLQRLIAKDVHRRFKVCYPGRADLGSTMINVHSKVLIVDDAILTVGSANLNNRSMGFDTECNLALSTDGQPHMAKVVAGLRNRFLAEHLGTSTQKVAASLKETGSLLSTLSALKNSSRFLHDLPVAEDTIVENSLARKVVDPERPVDIYNLLDYMGIGADQEGLKDKFGKKGWVFVGLLVAALILAFLWRWSPLGQWLNKESLLTVADLIRDSPAAIPTVLVIYVLGSCLMFPVTLLILVTILSFGPFLGFSLAWSGSLLGGLISYLTGRWVGRDVVRRLSGEKLNRISLKLAKRGWLTIAMVRIVPIAPFTIINMVAGSSHISLPSFMIGTALGMAPGILLITLFGGSVEQAFRDPGWMSVAFAAAALIFYVIVLILGKRLMLQRDKSNDA